MSELLRTLGWLAIVFVAYRLGREDGRIRLLGGREAKRPSLEEIMRQASVRGEWSP